MRSMMPDFKTLLKLYLPKAKGYDSLEHYPFDEFTLDITPEQIAEDLAAFKALDKWVEEANRHRTPTGRWRADI